MPERIAVVDRANRFLRWEDRRTVHRNYLLHRSVHVAILDARGRLVLQKRHAEKRVYPSTWDISCNGHVDEEDYVGGWDEELDRVYERAAHRELVEELGIATELSFVAHVEPMPLVHYEHIHLFRGTHDGPYEPEPSEIEELRRVEPDELTELVAGSEPTTRTLPVVADLLRAEGMLG